MTLLKDMIENIVNENETDAKVNFHSYLINKMITENVSSPMKIDLGENKDQLLRDSNLSPIRTNEKIIDNEYYYIIHENNIYKFVKVKVTEYTPSQPEGTEGNIWGSKEYIKLESVETGKDIYWSGGILDGSGLYEVDEVVQKLPKGKGTPLNTERFNKLSKKTSNSLFKSLKGFQEQFDRSFDIEGTTWNAKASIEQSDARVILTVAVTPEGKGNISHGNRMEITYLPLESGNEIKRHNGAFDTPRSAKDWLSHKVKVVSPADVYAEVKKAFNLVKSKDETAYNKYFNK